MPFLGFIRFPSVFVAVSCSFAGYMLVRLSGRGGGELDALGFVMGASVCLQFADAAWRNVITEQCDPGFRSGASSGRMETTNGYLVAVILSFVGIMLSMAAGMAPMLVSSGILLLSLCLATWPRVLDVFVPVLWALRFPLILFLGATSHQDIVLFLDAPRFGVASILLGAYAAGIGLLWQIAEQLPGSEDKSSSTQAESVCDYPSGAETEMEPAENVPESTTNDGTGNSSATTETRQADLSQLLERPIVALASFVVLAVPLAAAWLMPREVLSTFLLVIQAVFLAGLFVRNCLQDESVLARVMARAGYCLVPVLVCGIAASLAEGGRLSFTLSGYHLHLPLPGELDLGALALICAMAIPLHVFGRRIRTL